MDDGSIEGQMFCMVLMRDKIVVNDKIQRLGNVLDEGNVCRFCNDDDIENSRHLFIHCKWVYKVWSKVTKLQNMNFVEARDVVSTTDICLHMILMGPNVCI